MDGELVPGQTFTLRGLAAVFGTSPMPIRDALKRLVAEHSLEMMPNRSVRLPRMTRPRFQEILQARLSLESMLAERAAPLIGTDVIEAMAADHLVMIEGLALGNARQYLQANRRFHFRLYESAQSVVVLPIVATLWMQVGPYLHEVFQARGQATARADHHHHYLLKALRRQDPKGAARAVWDDLSDAADTILELNRFPA